jgi:hypothetical protein
MIALYPFLGGTSSSHAVNAKNPGTHDITWSGTVTHNSNGITGNGSDGYGDTNLNPSAHLSLDDNHIAVYSRTNSVSANFDIGVNGSNAAIQLASNYDGNAISSNGAGATEIYSAASRSDGLIVNSRTSSTAHEAYRHGTTIATNTSSNGSGSLSANNIYVCCRNNNGGAAAFTTRNYALASIGTGLSDADVTAYASAVEDFQDALGRGVI